MTKLHCPEWKDELEFRVTQAFEDNKAVLSESREIEAELKDNIAKQRCLVEQIKTLTRYRVQNESKS